MHDCGLTNVKIQVTHLIAKTFNALKGIAYGDTLLSDQLRLTQNISLPCCVLVNVLTLSSTILLGPYERNESHFQRKNLHNTALKKINPAGTAIKHVPLLCRPREAANINLSAKFT